MPDSVLNLREALDRVPLVLLNSADTRILADAKTSVDVLASIETAPSVVVLVGATGVGKSYLFNRLVGVDASRASREGVLRPTTRSVIAAGSANPFGSETELDFVVVPDAARGVVFIDTPAYDANREVTEVALKSADLGVLVLSPGRYGDSATRDTWESLASLPERAIVLNRLRGTVAERSETIAAVEARFAPTPVLTVDEGGSAELFAQSVLTWVEDQGGEADSGRVSLVAASEMGRYIASAATAASAELGQLGEAVEATPVPEFPDRGLTVLESWLATEQELGHQVKQAIHALDEAIVEVSGTPIAQRMLGSLDLWGGAALESRLGEWRSETADHFRKESRMLWRRSAGEHLLVQASWKVGVNPDVKVAGRVQRFMGARFDPATREVHAVLLTILNDAIRERKATWESAVDVAGMFRPGELLAAADALGEQ